MNLLNSWMLFHDEMMYYWKQNFAQPYSSESVIHYSFIIHFFIHSLFIHSFLLIIHSFMHQFISLFIRYSLVVSFFCSFAHLSVCMFTHLFIHFFFVHTCIQTSQVLVNVVICKQDTRQTIECSSKLVILKREEKSKNPVSQT